jgi:von Willebrand factor type A domain-containing protein
MITTLAQGQATDALLRKKIVNHVAIVLDASPSMSGHVHSVARQVKELISDLAEQSKAMDQETRVTVYAFATEVRVLAFDTDVLRLPDINYQILSGYTALVDATVIGLDDLASTSTIYGDHGFLVYVITDGQENDSRRYSPSDALNRMTSLADGWTIAGLAPDVRGARYMRESLGIPGDNVAIWDASRRGGFEAASTQIRGATASYMKGRASGVRSTRSLFSTGVDAVNQATVSATLAPLSSQAYLLSPVGARDMQMDQFFAANGVTYRTGNGYYQWTKTETVGPQKQIAVVRKATDEVFTDDNPGSPAVRDLIGMSKTERVRLRPDHNPEYTIFVQSTAPNRKVLRGTKALVRTPLQFAAL